MIEYLSYSSSLQRLLLRQIPIADFCWSGGVLSASSAREQYEMIG